MGDNMAEVRKKVLEDTYNTSKIKVKEKKKEKKDTKKEVKKTTKNNTPEEKKSLFVRFRIFCNGVKNEFLKVHWTSKKDMVKYSIAVIMFIIFCSLFFFIVYVLFALLQKLILGV